MQFKLLALLKSNKLNLFQNFTFLKIFPQEFYLKKREAIVARRELQLYWICKSIILNSKTITTLFHIHSSLFQNESIEKTAIGFAVASLFALEENKNILKRNLKSFCKAKGVNWMVRLIVLQ